MAEVQLITDSASDLSDELYQAHHVAVTPFYVTFDKQVYYKERIDISISEFFKRLRTENVFPSTSLPTAMDYEEIFRSYLQQERDIVCLCITAKFSGSYQNAVAAANQLRLEYPGRDIYVIDSLQASGGQGVTLLQMIKMKQAGYSAAQITQRVEELKPTSRVFLTVDSLKYLQKGGRIGKVSALAGTLLQIKPIIVQKDGELNPVAKVRGRQKALDRIVEMARAYVGDRADAFAYILLHADCREEALPVGAKMKSMGINLELPIQDLGVTVGSHTGPTLIGIALIQKYDAL